MSTMQQIDYQIGLTENLGANQFLTFMLAGEEYGLDILRVQEIKGWDSVAAIPNTPSYIKGVFNLRGTIVPIIDLRERFGLENLNYGPTTVVIILSVKRDDHTRIMGMVVDAVSDVYSLGDDQIKPPPELGSAIDTTFVKGLATVDQKLVILLDTDLLFNSGELAILDSLSQQ
jgi:purine-binding chemotaxis protein CheW